MLLYLGSTRCFHAGIRSRERPCHEVGRQKRLKSFSNFGSCIGFWKRWLHFEVKLPAVSVGPLNSQAGKHRVTLPNSCRPQKQRAIFVSLVSWRNDALKEWSWAAELVLHRFKPKFCSYMSYPHFSLAQGSDLIGGRKQHFQTNERGHWYWFHSDCNISGPRARRHTSELSIFFLQLRHAHFFQAKSKHIIKS